MGMFEAASSYGFPLAAPDEATASREAPRYLAYGAAWAVIAAAVPIAAAILSISGMRLQLTGVVFFALSLAMLSAAHLYYQVKQAHQPLALATGIFAMMFLSSLVSGIICHAGLRLGTPWIDGILDTADRAMGIDTPRLAIWLAVDSGLGQLFNLAYHSTAEITFLVGLWLSFRGQAEQVWELGFCYVFCIIFASTFSALFPAVGAMVYHNMGDVPGLPFGAGTFHLDAIHYFRSSTNPVFDWNHVNGVVTFPSFHLVMAMLIPYACRNNPLLFWITAIWAVLVAISAICIGGHYVVDLLGGAAIWAVSAWIAGRFFALPQEPTPIPA